jgi:hypothetical protein
MTEEEMRDDEKPWPKSRAELNAYLDKLEVEQLDYGKAVYVMSLAAIAAFNYASHIVGASGFQASCADLDFMRRSRRLENFMIVDLNDAMYPQTDPLRKVSKWLNENKQVLAEKAQKELDEKHELVHPDVERHWRSLANEG